MGVHSWGVPRASPRTGLRVHLVLVGRFDQMGQSGLERVVGTQNVNVHDGLERIDRELVDGGQEIPGRTSATVSQRPTQTTLPLDTHITKSMAPNSLTQRSTASWILLIWRTSTAPTPMTLAPGRAVAISRAADSVLSTFRPMMQALAPK